MGFVQQPDRHGIIHEGNLARVWGSYRDITIRKQAEEKIRKGEEFTALALDAQLDTFFLFDPSAKKALRWNRAFRDISAYSDEEIARLPAPDSYYGPEDLERVEAFFEKVTRDGTGTIELALICKNGCRVPTEYKASVITDENGESKYIISIGRDITGRKKMEEQLRQSEKMEAVGQLAGGIAHDFNNQLSAVLGFAEILREDTASNTQLVEYCDKIISSVERASDLTTKLLAFSRKGNYVVSPVDIHRLIIEVTEVLRRTVDKRIEIKQHLDASISSVLGDASQLQNALLNLGLNARDAMPEGGELLFSTKTMLLDETIPVKMSRDLKSGTYIRISVSDMGVGIPEEIITSIFEPFFTTKEPGKGTGMGLAAVHGTVSSHGGYIEVQSAPGNGTTFEIYLPAHEVRKPSDHVPEERKVFDGKGNILFVDDEDLICQITRQILTNIGYHVDICREGKQAVDYFCSSPEKFDLVILDLVMPKMSGKEAFEKMKRKRPDIKILLSSGYNAESGLQGILDAGANGFIQKPFRKALLAQKVAEILETS